MLPQEKAEISMARNNDFPQDTGEGEGGGSNLIMLAKSIIPDIVDVPSKDPDTQQINVQETIQMEDEPEAPFLK